MLIEPNKCYMRRNHFGYVTVRKVISIINGLVHYNILCGSKVKDDPFGNKCKLKNFKKWLTAEIEELPDYSHLTGAKIEKNYLVKSSDGIDICVCTEKRVNKYIEKGHAKLIDENTIQFTNSIFENKVKEIYGNNLSDFFLQIKNDHCVICNRNSSLTRHHVVPKRVLPTIPLLYKQCISNVLFVCTACHRQYENGLLENEPENNGDPKEYIKSWEKHFREKTGAQYIPKGWQLVSVEKNMPQSC